MLKPAFFNAESSGLFLAMSGSRCKGVGVVEDGDNTEETDDGDADVGGKTTTGSLGATGAGCGPATLGCRHFLHLARSFGGSVPQ